jgi:sugar phosphate isomerase/epimerase
VSTTSARPVGLQLWSVRERCTHDFAGTLEAVAELGYAGVEHVDSLRYGGLTATEVRRRSDALGLAAAGVHVAIEVLEGDLDRVLDDSAVLGAPYVVCAWLPPARRRGADDFHELAGSLERIGHRCHAAGARLLYHHHDFELRSLDGPTGLEIISSGTTPDLVGLELDVYWLTVAGLDPVAAVRAAGDRSPLVHLKDLTDGPGTGFPEGEGLAHRTTEVGAGTLDLPGILAAASAAEWLLVEQDFSASDSLESARISLRNLERLQAS